MSNVFLVSLFEHKAWCNRQLVEALRAAHPNMDQMNWAVVMLTFDHTANVDRVFRARLEGTEPDLSATVARAVPELQSLADRMAETDAWYLRYAAAVSSDELEEIVDFTFIDDAMPGRMTKGDMLGHIITHGASHRGAIGKMLERLKLPGAPDMMTTFRRPLPG
jgi:uncharacterized damage-inducible protein DinB